MKRIFAALALTLALPASADQMVINGNAIRDGDSIAKLVKYAGLPLVKSSRRACFNKSCTQAGLIETWAYIDNGIEYKVVIIGDTIRAIDWKHSH